MNQTIANQVQIIKYQILCYISSMTFTVKSDILSGSVIRHSIRRRLQVAGRSCRQTENISQEI